MPGLRIAVVAPPWLPVPPPSYGGTEAVIDELARGLQTVGHDVRLVTIGESTCPVPRVVTYDRVSPDEMGKATIELRHALRAYEVLDDVDVIHDHTLAGPVLAAASRFDVPVVTTNHGPFDEDLSGIYRSIGRSVSVIAISHHQAMTARGVPIAKVIHHGVDVSNYPVGSGDGGYVVFLGRMSSTKGVDVAARAARAAGMPLVIAAKMREPAERDYFDQAVRPLLGPGVEYVGEVGASEKLELLAGAEALVNPIRWPEPFGMVMIEALACGTPVIAFPNGAAPEIVDSGLTGFLCRDEYELVDRLQQACRLPRAACRAIADERFSSRRMVERHVELYRDLCCGRLTSSTRPSHRGELATSSVRLGGRREHRRAAGNRGRALLGERPGVIEPPGVVELPGVVETNVGGRSLDDERRDGRGADAR